MNWSIGVWYSNATEPDACPFITGYSVEDRFGCPDADSDGWSNPDSNWTAKEGADAFPDNPTQWSDMDGDGWGDNQSEGALQVDDFPDNPTQWLDTDGDGWGTIIPTGLLKSMTSHWCQVSIEILMVTVMETT